MEQSILAWIVQYGYLAIFVLLALGIVGLPIPDETLLTFTGFLIFKGHLNPWMAYAAALAGSMSGITISYTLGRRFGLPLIHRYGRYLRIREKHLQKAHAFFESAGHWSLTFGYFVPGVRHFTAYAAGMSELEPPKFALFAYGGAAIWAATFITVGYWLGERWHDVLANIHSWFLGASVTAAVVIAAYVIWHQKYARKS